MKNKVITELKRIARENGGLLQPEIVVQEARLKTSPLHRRFTWDDGEAALQYRIWQARQLIRVSVEILTGTKTAMDVFVSLSPDRQRESGGYRIMTDVLSNSEMRAIMFKDALEELECFREKYQKLKELVVVFSAIKKVRRK
jgi:hypothetical protein